MSKGDRGQALEQAFDNTTSVLYPIQFKDIGTMPHVPVPLARISSCGLFRLEVLQEVVNTDPPQGRYQTFVPQQMRGATQVVTFLKVVVSQAHRFATKDWIAEHIRQRQEDADPTRMRLDNVVWLLRNVLLYAFRQDDDPERADLEQLSSRIMSFVRAGKNSGAGYQLADYPLIWLDADAIAWYVEQGTLFDSFADDSLPYWEQAYKLAMRGVYLADETYSDWTNDKRNEMQGHLRQCVHVLYRKYLGRGPQGEERAILLLRRYLLAYPTEEDMLRPLMELLGKRECYQEALEYYQRLCDILKEEGREPDERTQKTARYLSTKQIQREITSSALTAATLGEEVAATHLAHPPHETNSSFSYAIVRDIMKQPSTESSDLSQHRGIQPEYSLESDNTVDRREMAKRLILGLTFFTAPSKIMDAFHTMQPRPSEIEEILSDAETSNEKCLRLSEGRQLGRAERLLWSYLPEVEDLAQQSSQYQQQAANIAARSFLIAASLVGHHNDLQMRQHFSEQSWLYGSIAQDCNLQVAALRQLAVTFDYLERPYKVLQTYQRAFPYLDDISPRLRACVYAAISGVYAQMQQKQEAYRFIGLAHEHFPEHIEDEPSVLRLINANYHTIILWEGLNHLELGQPQLAERTLNQIDVFTPKTQIPERIRVEFLNYQAKASTAAKKMELACTSLEIAIKASVDMGSERRLQESFAVLQQMREKWPHEQKVQELGDFFLQSLINHTH